MAKLKSNLSKLAAAMPKVAGKVLKKTGLDVADVASQLSPYKTGNLSGSFKEDSAVQQVNEGLVYVGTPVEYSGYVENSTPYFSTSFQEAESIFTEYMKQEIEREIESNRV